MAKPTSKGWELFFLIVVFLIVIFAFISGIVAGVTLSPRVTVPLPALGLIALILWGVATAVSFTGWKLVSWPALTQSLGWALLWPLGIGYAFGAVGRKITLMAGTSFWMKAAHFTVLTGVILVAAYSADGVFGTVDFPIDPSDARLAIMHFIVFAGPVVAVMAWLASRGRRSRWLIGSICGAFAAASLGALDVAVLLTEWDQVIALGVSGVSAAGLVASLIGLYIGALWRRPK